MERRTKTMIRTETVNITSINGIAYKQKLTSGGAGITIITPDDRAAFTINKRDGSCTPYGTVNGELFTGAVITEALELTKGLPYKRMGTVAKVYADNHCDEGPVDLEVSDEKIEIDVIASAEYKVFLSTYTDKRGRFSYQLMNKDLMQFASKSSVVSKKLAEKEKVDDIVRYVVKSKAADLCRNKGMSDDMLTVFIDTFDSMDTRSAFKELRAYLRGKLSRKA
jgi:hypothetical protein